MSEQSRQQVVLSSRVRLARNFPDLPFDSAAHAENADECIRRTAGALAKSGEDKGFSLIRLHDLSDVERRVLCERHLISSDLLRAPDNAAVLLHEDAAVSIMINEEDHLRIQAICPGMDVEKAAAACFRADDALSRQTAFAFDGQLGYLTASPTNTGTGMRASLLVHLPMVTRLKQMGSVGQIVAMVGLTIHGVYGEQNEALGHVYQISNQSSLGRSEDEIISAVTAAGCQLMDMELKLREKALSGSRATTEDCIWRAWGILSNARLIGLREFFKLWSDVRMGAAMGMLPVTLDAVDQLLDQAQDAHLQAYAEKPLDADALCQLRAERVRTMLAAGLIA